jgi:capsular polysaccharide biosynthesis protein
MESFSHDEGRENQDIRTSSPESRSPEEINPDSWWRTLGVLYAWRRFIIIVTVLAAVSSIVISLMMANVYRSSTRLLLPEGSGGGIASAMLGNLSSAASSLLGGGGGDYVRYMAILSSDTVLEAAVDTFDLIQTYEYEEEEFPLFAAINTLKENLSISIDDEYEFMSIAVVDESPERAAELTNFFVRALDRVQNELSSRTAGL